MTRALIFDCDGVLSDTERYGHLVAFNAMFAEVGVPIRWTDEQYAQLVTIGGGKERLAHALSPRLLADLGLAHTADEIGQLVRRWHAAKTRHYQDLVEAGALPPRPGVARLTQEALARGWRVAVASTSAEATVRTVLDHAVGRATARRFEVFAGDVVAAKKPAPDIYLLALRELGVGTGDAVVVEDSNTGLRASLAAGLRTVITVSSYTIHDDFTGAALVADSLGEPDAPSTARHDPAGLLRGSVVDVSVLEQVLRTPSPQCCCPDRT